MLTLVDVATCIAALGIVDREHIYCGKMQDKKMKCIGVYNLNRSQSKTETIGGDANSSYRVKRVSFLVHWDRSTERTERAADSLYEAVKTIKGVSVNETRILFTRMLTDTPVDVGTDDNGIYEMVIETEIYYER